jgi:isopenicillin N synthase-like dioxygenase
MSTLRREQAEIMEAQIPVIDLTDARSSDRGARLRLGQLIDRTCTEIGFFTITGHGVPPEAITTLNRKAHEFFALPMEEKQEVIPADIKSPRGYKPVGYEALGHGNANMTPPDLKEYYHLGRESWPSEPYYTSSERQRYFIKNVWPRRPAGFAEAAARYYGEMERLVGVLMRVSALGLGIDEHFFDDKIDKHITAMRLNFYPEVKEPPKPGQLRGGEHTDYGLLTILNGENVPGGLQVKTRRGEWIDVETDPTNFVCNIGDLLMRWTNDRWVSNVHRVVTPPSSAAGAKRLSMAFFHHPNYDTLVECIAPAGKAKYPPVSSGEYRDLKYRQTRLMETPLKVAG